MDGAPTDKDPAALATPVSAVFHQAKCVDVDTFVSEFLNKLDWRSQKTVIVLDNQQQVYGIITRQDIVNMDRRQMNPRATRAWEICSHHVIEISPDASLSEAIETMSRHHIHHLVVTDKEQFKGVISALDITEYFSQK